MEYDHLPHTSSKTDEGYCMAMQHWKEFLQSKAKPLNYALDERNIMDILNQFATYLVTLVRKSDDDYYSVGSVLQFSLKG